MQKSSFSIKSPLFHIIEDAQKGRCCVALQDIKAGTLIAQEKPYINCIYEKDITEVC